MKQLTKGETVMKTTMVAVLAVVLTIGANVVLACGGGSPVTMTVNTSATFDAAPANYTPPTEGSADVEVM